LKKEIVKHIFKSLGIFDDKISGVFEPLTSNKYLVDKKIIFQDEANKDYQNNIWAVKTKFEASEIKILVADISEEIREFAIIIQMDSFHSTAMRISEDPDDCGSICFNPDQDIWINVSVLHQAKVLFGIESLVELCFSWEKINNYHDMYKILISFLNFYNENG
jgi:hypothetical protein